MAELQKAASMFFVGFIALYLLILLVVWLGQEQFIFQASQLPRDYAFQFDVPFEEITIPTADRVNLNALFFQSDANTNGAILYFHGNRGTLSRWGHMHRPFTRLGYDVLIIDYRGYGKSGGEPTESGLYMDAEAALQWLKQHHPVDNTIAYGRSLGSGVAAYLATQHSFKALILETPYDLLTNVIQHKVLLPVPKQILRHHFPNKEYLPKAKCPVHIFAGSKDRLIPLKLSEQLIPALQSPDDFKIIQGAGHRNLAAFKAFHFELAQLLLP